jgi:hypothetical protein
MTAGCGVGREAYIDGVRRAQEYIAAGDVYQLVLSSRFSGRHDLDPFQAYRALRLINPSPYMYLLRAWATMTVVGSSPEALVKLNGRARRAAADRRHAAALGEADLDAHARAELLADPKENAEHVMLVDLARNDLGRVARAGQRARRAVPRHRALQPRDAHRQRRARQLAPAAMPSTCSPRHFRPARWSARRRCARWRSSRSSSPCGAACTAAPWATSARSGDMDQAITIRTLVFHGDEYSYQAGAGIVADSQPETSTTRCCQERGAARALRWRRKDCERALLLIDNYDSFTYNLVQAFLVLGADVRCTATTRSRVEQARALAPTHLCISPGPGTPQQAGVSIAMIRAFAGQIPVFGVCLGHQSIVEAFGGKVVCAPRLMHGKTSPIEHDGRACSRALRSPARWAAITR